MDDTITAIATPIGEGGISVIRISGKDAVAYTANLFPPFRGKSLSDLSQQKVYFGEIRDPATDLGVDEVLVTLFKAPKSYTCEDVVEISAHGGVLVSSKILHLVLGQGARLAQPGEFTRRAFVNGRLDLTQAEAVSDLIHSSSDRALASALAQLKRGLSDKVTSLYDRLLAIMAQLEAAIDFPEEGLKFQERKKTLEAVGEIQNEVNDLIASFRQGKIYREGMKVALVGKPNVGKSSLLNALLKEDRAIVTPYPGTTRDVLEEKIKIRDVHINILDTAGLRSHPETIEKEGIARTRSALAQADLALLVFDGSQPLDPNDDLLIREAKDKSYLALINKSDLPRRLETDKLSQKLPGKNPIYISATTLKGMEDLIDAVHSHAMSGARSGENLVITRERHRNLLVRVKEGLERACTSLEKGLSEDLVAVDIQSSMDYLGEIIGKNFADDLLDKIFGEFCIGK